MKGRRKTTLYLQTSEGMVLPIRTYLPICLCRQGISLKDAKGLEVACKQAKQKPACAALDLKDRAEHKQHNRKDERRFMSNGFRNKERRRLAEDADLPTEGVPTS